MAQWGFLDACKGGGGGEGRANDFLGYEIYDSVTVLNTYTVTVFKHLPAADLT